MRNSVAEFVAVFFDQFGLRTKGSMNGKLPIIEKERFLTVATFQPVNGFLCHAIVDMFPGLALFEAVMVVTPWCKIT